MDRRSFSKCLLGLPTAITFGVQAKVLNPFLENSLQSTLFVVPSTMISSSTTNLLRSRYGITTVDDWSDISEVWFQHLAGNVRANPINVVGLTLESHLFAIQEFSRGQQFEWSSTRQLKGASLEKHWSEKQISDAIKMIWKSNFVAHDYPKGEHKLISWSRTIKPYLNI